MSLLRVFTECMCASSRAITPLTCSPGLSTVKMFTISSHHSQVSTDLESFFHRVVNLFSPCDRDTISIFLLPSPDRAFLIWAPESAAMSVFCSLASAHLTSWGQFINIHKPVSVDEQKFRVDYRSFFHRNPA